jgi:hypothetical protein
VKGDDRKVQEQAAGRGEEGKEEGRYEGGMREVSTGTDRRITPPHTPLMVPKGLYYLPSYTPNGS